MGIEITDCSAMTDLKRGSVPSRARALVDSTDEADLFLYPGKEHLFADSSLASYDQAAATLLMRRVLSFLKGIR